MRLRYVPDAVRQLEGTAVGVACVVGFHEGTQSTEDKIKEATAAIGAGATELDVVLNRELLQADRYTSVYKELRQLRECAQKGVKLKLILETSQLSPDEVIVASVVAGHAGFDFIKTSTGFCGRGASVEDVQLMRQCREYLYSKGAVPSAENGDKSTRMQIKASGGIRSYVDALKMVQAGATRLGTSSGTKIAKEAKQSASGSTGDAVQVPEPKDSEY